VVGLSHTAGDAAQHATLWSGGVATDVGTLGGTGSWAVGINNAGQVVGTSGGHATLWSGGVASDLGTLGGTWSEAYGINNAGQVVGGSYTAGNAAEHVTLWSGGATIDLSDVLSSADQAAGWVFDYFLADQLAINDNGWIALTAINANTGYSRAYLLTPQDLSTVPEPAGLALTAVALAGLVASRRRPLAQRSGARG
jgi:probable HAF family extracellular repeat protein